MAVVSISLPEPLLDQADRCIQARGFTGRSELLRAALRDFLTAEEARGGRTGLTSATVTLLYPHGAERRIGELRHDFTDVVQSMMHGHAEGACVELFLCKGQAERIGAFTSALRAAKETILVQEVYTDLPTGAEAHHDH